MSRPLPRRPMAVGPWAKQQGRNGSAILGRKLREHDLLLVGICRTSQRREGLQPPSIKGLAPYRGLHRPRRLAIDGKKLRFSLRRGMTWARASGDLRSPQLRGGGPRSNPPRQAWPSTAPSTSRFSPKERMKTTRVLLMGSKQPLLRGFPAVAVPRG